MCMDRSPCFSFAWRSRLETIAEFPLDAAEIMAKRKYGCAIVVDEGGRIEGIFTTIDALGALVDALRRSTNQDTA